MHSEDSYFTALKLFLVLGPLLGFAALELVLWLRDRRRVAQGRPLLPERRGGGAPRAVRLRARR